MAGLVAARELAASGRDVLLLEASPQVGGKLRSAQVAGLTVDVGAEAMLARRPEGVGLAASLGVDVVHPTTATSSIFSRGALRPMPRSLMGVPFDLAQLADSGVLTPEGLARASTEVDELAAMRNSTTWRLAWKVLGPYRRVRSKMSR